MLPHHIARFCDFLRRYVVPFFYALQLVAGCFILISNLLGSDVLDAAKKHHLPGTWQMWWLVVVHPLVLLVGINVILLTNTCSSERRRRRNRFRLGGSLFLGLLWCLSLIFLWIWTEWYGHVVFEGCSESSDGSDPNVLACDSLDHLWITVFIGLSFSVFAVGIDYMIFRRERALEAQEANIQLLAQAVAAQGNHTGGNNNHDAGIELDDLPPAGGNNNFPGNVNPPTDPSGSQAHQTRNRSPSPATTQGSGIAPADNQHLANLRHRGSPSAIGPAVGPGRILSW
ncbi:hypothetical protein QBC43DRAFT_293556 [Cladorrhinum sp. PSN259]|nr:hypothetical protein QBC43DRAFT_293556 [Cladorrhinum sp. PSN259]